MWPLPLKFAPQNLWKPQSMFVLAISKLYANIAEKSYNCLKYIWQTIDSFIYHFKWSVGKYFRKFRWSWHKNVYLINTSYDIFS